MDVDSVRDRSVTPDSTRDELQALRRVLGEATERLEKLEDSAATALPASSEEHERLLVFYYQSLLLQEIAARRSAEGRIRQLLDSTSWRLTGPLRRVLDRLRDNLHNGHAPGGDASIAPHPFSLARPSVVDVIVCVKDQIGAVRACLDSVRRCSTVPMRLIVVDDASGPETAGYLRSLADPHLTLHRNRQSLGYTRSANLGLRSGRSPYRVLLNSDTVVTRGWLERLLRCMESSPDTAIVGPLSNHATYQSVPRIYDAGGWATNPIPFDLDDWSELVAVSSERAHPAVPNVTGMCWMVRASVLEQVGAFDEELSSEGYGEENDFARRAESAGFRCRVADDCFVFHAGGTSFGGRRRVLEERAHRRYIERFGRQTVEELDARLRSNPTLDRLRERLIATTEAAESPRILFLLPSLDWCGGVVLVLEIVRWLRRLGRPVRFAAPATERSRLHDRDRAGVLWYERHEDLDAVAGDFDGVVATHNGTIVLQERLLERNPELVPFYFIQDDETFFYDGDGARREEALRSYRMAPLRNAYAVSSWVVERFRSVYGVPVEKVAGGIDLAIFDPCRSRPIEERRLKIAAMIRPLTPWRAPERTLAVFERLGRRYPERLRFVTFGCEAHELAALAPGVPVEHHGLAPPEWIHALLRNVDVFLDLSTHQAFGRTALEAMAAGCAVVVPREGGTQEFAADGENALVCDTSSESAILEAVGRVIEDPSLRSRLRRAAVSTAFDHGIARSACEQYDLFRRRIGAAREGRATVTSFRELPLEPEREARAGAAAAGRFRDGGEADPALHVSQLLDVQACLGRFLFLRRAAPISALGENGTILVSGFGLGSEMIAARRSGFGRVVGVEVDPALVTIASERLRGIPEMHPILYGGDRLPFAGETFRVVVSGHVIEHTRDPELYLAECLRVLAPRGVLSLEFPTRYHRVELHSGLPSLEWLPRGLRRAGLGWLSGPVSPLSGALRRRYGSILEGGLQPVSLRDVRAWLSRSGCDARVVGHVRAAPGIIRCLIEKRF